MFSKSDPLTTKLPVGFALLPKRTFLEKTSAFPVLNTLAFLMSVEAFVDPEVLNVRSLKVRGFEAFEVTMFMRKMNLYVVLFGKQS